MSDIDDIKSRLNIVDVLGGYIRLEKAGTNWRANCPFHNEKSPSFMVSEDKQIWHCFGCQKGGDIFGFVMEIEGLDFKGALNILADKAGVELKKTNPKQAAEKNRTLEILEMATKFYQAHLLQTAPGKKILEYLYDRGINDESIKDFRLGYAPKGWSNTMSFLMKKGFTVEEIAKTGLLVEKNRQDAGATNYQPQTTSHYDRFRDRIMFPIADSNDKVVGYSARVAPGGDESQAKYVNSPETEVYHKSKILYGISRAKNEIRLQKSALLVEGNMDVIAAHQAGLKNTVAVSGTALTQEHLNIIKRYADKIDMCFDMDNAGELATKKSIKLCFEKEVNVRVVQLPSGKDAADLAKNNPEILRESVEKARPAMEYFFDKVLSKYNKEKVEDKKIISEELLEMIGFLANEIEKSHWLKKLAAEIDIDENILTDMLKKASLRDRVVRTSQDLPQESKIFAPSGKIETLTKDLVGLMLVYSDVWKEMLDNEDLSFVPKDSLLSVMIQNGGGFHFSFDELTKNLESQSDRAAAEKIYFETRYKIGLDNSLAEIVLEKPLAEAKNRLQKIKYEINKSRLDKISKDLDAARKKSDALAVKFLGEEYTNINAEQAVLNKAIN
ncbi:MAG: primase protein [Candidatus Moranbacteria bacterium GW2011_GWA2_39_41]|nr:MAG: primase protein [Candidatus Moranbacteria bacterium GW2011_GWA2_39_41]